MCRSPRCPCGCNGRLLSSSSPTGSLHSCLGRLLRRLNRLSSLFDGAFYCFQSIRPSSINGVFRPGRSRNALCLAFDSVGLLCLLLGICFTLLIRRGWSLVSLSALYRDTTFLSWRIYSPFYTSFFVSLILLFPPGNPSLNTSLGPICQVMPCIRDTISQSPLHVLLGVFMGRPFLTTGESTGSCSYSVSCIDRVFSHNRSFVQNFDVSDWFLHFNISQGTPSSPQRKTGGQDLHLSPCKIALTGASCHALVHFRILGEPIDKGHHCTAIADQSTARFRIGDIAHLFI